MADKYTIDKNFNGKFDVVIKHWLNRSEDEYSLQYPILEDGVKWETDRVGSPAKLTFKVYKDKNGGLDFQEGDDVTLRWNDGFNVGWNALFDGVIFTKSRNKNGWIDVTAYDRLRYFKNKDSKVYTNKKANELLKELCDKYKLTTGTVEETNYRIGSRSEDNQSIFDIVQNALDLTLISGGKMYILYADSSGICLRDAENLKTNVVINDSVAEDFDYESTIDDGVYNDIQLYYDNDKTNKREWYPDSDIVNINNWGLLTYTESIQNPANAKDRAKTMLKLYNKKGRTLKVKNAFGVPTCRAGASVIVNLELGDIEVNNYMMIEKATHVFKKDQYRMDLTLSDKEFSV